MRHRLASIACGTNPFHNSELSGVVVLSIGPDVVPQSRQTSPHDPTGARMHRLGKRHRWPDGEDVMEPTHGTLVGIAPIRLAVATRRKRLPASVIDDAHNHVAELGLEWQQLSGLATFWELGATAQGADEGRAYALAGQMASAGEQLVLAHAAGVEVALWRDVREKAEPDVAHEMSMRAMAEAQCLFVIGTGHALANVAVRTLALDPGLRVELVRRFGRTSVKPTFDPFSQARADWVSLNHDTCKAIRAVARSHGAQEVIELVEPVAALEHGSTWRALEERRGEDFHRWRPQTHGIQGVARKSPWTRKGSTRSLGLGSPPYEDAGELADQTADLATQGMLALARSMDAFMAKWPAASGPLGGPNFGEAASGTS